MKRRLSFYWLCAFCFWTAEGYASPAQPDAVDELEAIEETVPIEESEARDPALTETEKELLESIESQAVNVTILEAKTDPKSWLGVPRILARFDTAFLTSHPTLQGFHTPSFRFGVAGKAKPWLHYRLAVGQTREYATVLLPQLLPVDAYVEVRDDVNLISSRLRWKTGIFTPDLNPSWTPDVGELDYPDYLESHRALFLGRETGTQISFVGEDDWFEASLGYTNGSGLFGLNTNNAKAFHAYVRNRMDWRWAKVSVGASGYSLTQSRAGNLNYKETWLANVFASFEIPGLSLFAETLVSRFATLTEAVHPRGFSAGGRLGLADGVELFGRWESVDVLPLSSNAHLRHYQLGVTLRPYANWMTFLSYRYLDKQTIHQFFEIRMRFLL